MQSAFTHSLTPFLVMTTFAMSTLALGAYAYQTVFNENAWETNTISISGEAEVVAIPDVAIFTLAVRADGEDATTAQSQAAEINNVIVSYLKEQGVVETDIRTTSYNVNPRYRYNNQPCTPTFCPPNNPIPDGFEVYQALTVKVRDTNTAGTLLAGVGNAGATDISGLSFTIDDQNKLKAEARTMAIVDAKAKAEVLAEALGVRLVEIVSFYEDERYQPMPYSAMGGDMMMRSEQAMVSPDIQVGESTITSRVSLTYKIK